MMNRSPYISDAPSVSAIMLQVLLALVPGIIAYVWVFGSGIVVTLLLATSTALVAEAVMLKIRKRPIQPFLTDYSASYHRMAVSTGDTAFEPVVADCCRHLVCHCYCQAFIWRLGLQPV